MPERPGVRWYRHDWNSDLSWRLILTVIPRVPDFLRPPVHFVATLICFVKMGAERRAARRNLRRVTGRGSPLDLLLSFRLFYNFSKFMVAYTQLAPYCKEDPALRVNNSDEALRSLREELARGRGVILLGMHVGQWDLALAILSGFGFPVTVVMRREDEESARYAAATRDAAGLKVAYTGENPWLSVELRSALHRNEIVAMQGDRSYGDRTAWVPLFGAPAEIPVGPWELARASGASVVPAVLVFEGHRQYRCVFGEPIRPGEAGSDPEDSRQGMARIAAALESIIRRYPDQWFNFYDVWPEESRGVGVEAPPAPGVRSRRKGFLRDRARSTAEGG